MSAPVAPEQAWAERLLLAVLREDADAARGLLARAPVSGETGFLAEADRHGLGGYLAGLAEAGDLQGALPASIREGLAARRRRIAMDNTLLLSRARPLLAALAGRGIEPIVLKGTALLGRVYRDAGSRLLSDLDLLVPAGRAAEAEALLPEFGLREAESSQRSARRRGYESDANALFAFDLHWDLSQRHRFQADLDGVWARSVRAELDGVEVRRLDREDEFLYLALHYASHYFGVTLKWLVDLRELLRHDPPDPATLGARARAWHGTQALGAACAYLEKIYPGVTPPAGAAMSPARRALLRPFLSPEPLTLVKPLPRGPARLLLGLLFVDRPADMLRLGRATLTGRPEHDHDH
jgi:hypothetical protein